MASGPIISTTTSTSSCSASTGAFYPMAGFATLLGLGATSPPTPIEQILSPLADSAAGRRPGRSTGLTSGRFSIEIIERSSLDNILADRGD